MSKIDRIEIPIQLEEAAENCWELVREHDGSIKRSVDVIWIEWDEDGKFKAKHTEPAIGRSLLMSPFNMFFTWQTTEVTELLEVSENYIKFRTNNNDYELIKGNDDLDKS